jgi:hypothetical protein
MSGTQKLTQSHIYEVHNSKLLHTCDICGSEFRGNLNLNLHIANEHGFLCQKCGRMRKVSITHRCHTYLLHLCSCCKKLTRQPFDAHLKKFPDHFLKSKGGYSKYKTVAKMWYQWIDWIVIKSCLNKVYSREVLKLILQFTRLTIEFYDQKIIPGNFKYESNFLTSFQFTRKFNSRNRKLRDVFCGMKIPETFERNEIKIESIEN